MKEDRKFTGFPIGPIVIILTVIIIPIPAILLDILIVLNLIVALLIITIVLYDKNVYKFSLLPTLLLVSTHFGLAVNISATRLILTRGADFNGRLIQFIASLITKFGNTGLIIGSVLFILLIAFQMTVVVKGVTRVAEAAARFNLDSLPVKLMAIEAEYSSGAIDENETMCRKEALQIESDFYCSLDGVSKFISGYAKIVLFIITASILGGVFNEALTQGQTIIEAVKTYLPLAIGSGFIFMLHSFLLALTVGIVVTRAADG